MIVKYINEDRVMISLEARIDYQVHLKVMGLYEALKSHEGIIEVSCGYHDILIHYDPDLIKIEGLLENLRAISYQDKHQVIRIPVCYESPYGLDVDEVCKYLKIDKATLIQRHTGKQYPVYMMGFLPGFPYLGGLDSSLEIPRRANPRTKIPRGSVGIGGKQTGIYPSASPGGWHIIGQTPLELLDLVNNDTLIHIGDWLEFYAIDEATFLSMVKGKAYEK